MPCTLEHALQWEYSDITPVENIGFRASKHETLKTCTHLSITIMAVQ
jgi:hypothetical protein